MKARGLLTFIGHPVYRVIYRVAGVFLDSTTDFTVDATSIDAKPEGVVRALITSPSGSLTEAIVKNQQNGLYQCLYTPVEQGTPATLSVPRPQEQVRQTRRLPDL